MDIFCNVIDNFGDAGFSLRLARSLINKGIFVAIYCDDLATLEKIATADDIKNKLLKLAPWPDAQEYQPSQFVIEAFSCRLPSDLMSKIRKLNSIVIELDYLTAEKFAEDCHGLSSSTDGLRSFFFFPGFTSKTGGLIFDEEFKSKVEKALLSHQNDQSTLKITVFSYENPKIKFIFNNLMRGIKKYEIKVFEGKALDNLNFQYDTMHLTTGNTVHLTNLSFFASPMSDQNIYDDILISSDLNLVRGEESAVRAMLSGKPFLWHIYPQDENAHIVKLNALFDRMLEHLPTQFHSNIELIRNFNLEYNGIETNTEFPLIEDFLPLWSEVTALWAKHLFSLHSLTDNLLAFLRSKEFEQ